MAEWTWSASTKNVTEVRVTLDGQGDEAWFLLRSDAHHDNRHTSWSLEKRHLDLAVERNAGILDGGDLHCAMQGKWDPRRDARQLRDGYHGERYLDELVERAADFYAPYADRWILMGEGNHETSIRKRHQTDLTERTVERLNTATGSQILAGSYAGWVLFRVQRASHRATLKLYRIHGYGGGGPVTRGVIQTNRMAVYLPDAHVVWSGHTHDQWEMPIARQRISEQGVEYKDRQIHLKTPGYKDEFSGGEGWHIERGAPPKPLGAAWLRIKLHSQKGLIYRTQMLTEDD